MKGYYCSAILCTILLFSAFLVFSAFADMKEIDDAELSSTKASVTGTPIKNLNCVEKDGACQEMKQNRVTSDNVAVVSSPPVSNTTDAIINKILDINGKEAFQFGMSSVTYSNRVGGTITSVQSH